MPPKRRTKTKRKPVKKNLLSSDDGRVNAIPDEATANSTNELEGSGEINDDNTPGTRNEGGDEMNDSNTPGTNNEGSSEINDDNTSTSTGKKRKTSKAQPESIKRIRASGEDKVYPKSLKVALADGNPLRANRRGLVALTTESEKPTFTYSELIRNRKMGLSYKQIGKKLGIDPSKEEVLTVYNVIHEGLEGNLPDVATIKAPSRVQPTTPLWFLFDSELDLIAKHALPSAADVLQHSPQNTVLEKLGDHAGYMLDVYLMVDDFLHEEIMHSTANARPSSQLGQMTAMSARLPIKLIDQVHSLKRAVAEAAYQMTDHWGSEQPKCKCGAVKIIRYKWKTQPIPHPSFFWGCVKFTPPDALHHDKATSYRHSVFDAVSNGQDFMLDKDLSGLADKLSEALSFWNSGESTSEDLEAASQSYGGPESLLPFRSTAAVTQALRKISSSLVKIHEERQGKH